MQRTKLLPIGAALAIVAAVWFRKRRNEELAKSSAKASEAESQRPKAVGYSNTYSGSSTPEMAAYTIPVHGYSLSPGPNGTGGWLRHRADAKIPGSGPGNDWISAVIQGEEEAGVDLSGASDFRNSAQLRKHHKPRFLVIYGSLREPRSFSKFCAYECARLLEALGADVRVFDPNGLPVRNPSKHENHPKVLELRALNHWAEGHIWVSPEMHGTITGTFKNQIDWLPLKTGSVRPSQGRTCTVLQINGGSQSFNAVNELRKLARWMRMPCVVNQSSVAKAWKEFDQDGRMKASSFRERVIDVMEESFKFTLIMREQADFLVDRYSERKEIAQKGRLRSQAEKEAELNKDKK